MRVERAEFMRHEIAPLATQDYPLHYPPSKGNRWGCPGWECAHVSQPIPTPCPPLNPGRMSTSLVPAIPGGIVTGISPHPQRISQRDFKSNEIEECLREWSVKSRGKYRNGMKSVCTGVISGGAS